MISTRGGVWKLGKGGYGWGVGGYKNKRLAGLCVWGSVAAEQR